MVSVSASMFRLSRLLSGRRLSLCRRLSDQTVVVRVGDSDRIVSSSWLRFSCGCQDCQDVRRHQRRLTPAEAVGARVASVQYDVKDFRVSWADGHASAFEYDELRRLLDGGAEVTDGTTTTTTTTTFWGDAERPDTSAVPAVDFFAEPEARAELLRRLRRFGFGIVDGVQPTESATVQTVERLAPVMPTLFGDVWTFTADEARQDSAYSSEEIGLHTDNTYLAVGAGLQVFHALERAPVGGSTVLADGFHAIQTLARENPDDLRLLAAKSIHHRYLETDGDGRCLVHMRSLDRVIKLDGDTPYQLRYNPYDIDALTSLTQEEAGDYLRAYARLSEILQRPGIELRLDLQPGSVLFIDNWRVLHGRSKFSGRRVMTGCYVSRDEWTSAARAAGVF